MDTSLTPLLQMKSRALFTLAILWKRILPLSGLGSLSPRVGAELQKWLKTKRTDSLWPPTFFQQQAPAPHLRWPPAAAWVWGHFGNPLQCFRSASRLSSSGSYTRLWRSGREKLQIRGKTMQWYTHTWRAVSQEQFYSVLPTALNRRFSGCISLNIFIQGRFNAKKSLNPILSCSTFCKSNCYLF